MEKSKSDLLKEATNLSQYLDDSTLRDVEAKTNVTPFLYYSVLTAALSGLSIGYDTGIIGIAMLILEKDHNLSSAEQTSIVGATTLGGAIGALGAGWIADFYGRKTSIYLGACLFVIGSLMMSLSSTTTVLLISRLITGIASGIASMVAPVYISEISPKYHRGQLVIYNVLLSNGATFIAILSGMVLVSDDGWRWMVAFASVPSLVQLFGLLFVPETPRFLVKHGNFEDARKVLSKIYPDSSQEFLDKDAKGSYRKLIQPPYLRPFLIVCAIVSLQELCGFDTFMYFSAILLNITGFTNTNDALKFSLFVYGGNFLMSGFSTKQNTCSDYGNNCNACIIDRRCTFNKLNGICVLNNNNSTQFTVSCENNNRFFVLGSLTFSIMAYALGIGSVTWLLQSELLPLSVRGRGVGIATAANWATNFLVGITFLPLINIISIPGSQQGIRIRGWTISTTKLPIFSSQEIDRVQKEISIPLPEMFFGNNKLRVTNEHGVVFELSPVDSLKFIDATDEGGNKVKVAYSEEWKHKSAKNHGYIKDVVKPYDWTYSTSYSEKLKLPEPILFYDEVILFEDELADNGTAILNAKVRVMPSGFFILQRFFLRVDDVLFQLNETRIYHEFGTKYLLKEYSSREIPYNKIKAQIPKSKGNDISQLTDPDWVSSKLPKSKEHDLILEKLCVVPLLS
ncbi:5389_t:CDS:10 [Cetraspora pellucida]|uniref:5389_t:CDS:1 n=1 Tax=Cetraspora pellucida TaxID=1433469 RepID=A0A9N9E4I3_9GLOM|nr:5389_t:CDS:10 [Cetraspora pellucida]